MGGKPSKPKAKRTKSRPKSKNEKTRGIMISNLKRDIQDGSERAPRTLAKKLLGATPETLDVIERLLDGQKADKNLTKKVDRIIKAQQDGRTRIEIRTVKPFEPPSLTRQHSKSADVLLLNANKDDAFKPPQRQESLSDDELIRPRQRRKSCLKRLQTEQSDDSEFRLRRRVSFLLKDGTTTFPLTQQTVRERTESEVQRRVSRRSLYDNEDSIQPHPDNDDSSSLHSEPSSEGKEKVVQPEPDLISEEVSSKSIKGWKGVHGKILQKPLGQPIVSKRSSLNVSSVRSRTSSAASEYSMNDAASLRPLRRNTIASYAQEKASPMHTPRGSIRSLQRSRASSAVSEYSDADRPMNIDRRMTYGSMTYSGRGTRANSLVTPSSGRSHLGSMRELQNWRNEKPRISDDNISEYSDADRPQLTKLATFGQLPTNSTDLLRTPSLLTNSTSESMDTSEYSDADTSSIATKFSRTGSQFSQMTRQSSFAESQISLNKEETTKDTFDTIDVSSDSVKPSLSLRTSRKTSE